MELDLHVHSHYSYDSLLKPAKILKIAEKKGLSGIAITDHNTIGNGVKTLSNNNLFIIVGCEVRTDFGDLIGLFLNEEIKSRKLYEVIDEIRDQEGIVVLPHPFRKQNHVPEELLKKVDLIEGLNARSSKAQNKKARDLSKKRDISMTAGSDAHLPMEIGRARTILPPDLDMDGIKKALMKGETKISGSESPYCVHILSVMIEKLKLLKL